MAPAKKSISGSVCLNHPDRLAESRCVTCFKPICSTCAIQLHGQVFCSPDCTTKYENSREGVLLYDEQSKRLKRHKLIRRVVILAVLGAVAYGGYRYLKRNPDRMKQLEQAADQLVDKGSELGVGGDAVTKIALGNALSDLNNTLAEGRFGDAAGFFVSTTVYTPYGDTRRLAVADFMAFVSANAPGATVSLERTSPWQHVEEKPLYDVTADLVFTRPGKPQRYVRLGLRYGKVGNKWLIGRVAGLSAFEVR